MYDTLENERYGEYTVIAQIRQDVTGVLEKSGIHTEARAYIGMLLSAVYATVLLAAKEWERNCGTMYAILAEPHRVPALFFPDIVKDWRIEYPALADFLQLNWLLSRLFRLHGLRDTPTEILYALWFT
jgi:hypothetical protein